MNHNTRTNTTRLLHGAQRHASPKHELVFAICVVPFFCSFEIQRLMLSNNGAAHKNTKTQRDQRAIE